jgi:hypothetical protein
MVDLHASARLRLVGYAAGERRPLGAPGLLVMDPAASRRSSPASDKRAIYFIYA